jgi:drug/metabolite transporter (DMT)-like permease
MARGRAPSPSLVGAAVLVSLGNVAVNGAGTSTIRGFMLSLGAFASDIAFALLASALLRRLSPLALAVYVCATAATCQAVAALAVDGSAVFPPLGVAQALAIGYLGMVVTAGSFLASNVALARLGVERTGLFNGLAPLIALLSTVAVGTSALTPLRAVGAVLVAAGVSVGLAGGSASLAVATAARETG